MIHMMSNEQKQKRKVIAVKGVTRIKGNEFLEEIYQAFKDGYVPAPVGSQWTADSPIFKHNRKMVVLYPEGYEVPEPNGDMSGVPVDEEAAAIAEVDKQILDEIEAEAKAEDEKVEDNQDLSDLLEETKVEEPEVTPEPEVAAPVVEAPEFTQEDPTVAEPEVPVKERIEAETRKVPLLALAEELKIEVPADKKNPAAIKQFLLNATAE